MMSLPRRLSIANGALMMAPAPEIASLRTGPRTGEAVKRLPTSAQEIRLALEPATQPIFDQSFVDRQGAAMLLRADPQQSPNAVRVGNTQRLIDKGLRSTSTSSSTIPSPKFSSTSDRPSPSATTSALRWSRP